jgi:ATP-binding cassette subfamily F protein 3
MNSSGTRFTLSRDELLTLPEFVLLSLFPNGLLPDTHMSNSYDGDVYPVDVSIPTSPSSSASTTVTQARRSTLRAMKQITAVLTNTELYLSDIYYFSQYDPDSLQYMLEFFRHVAQTLPASSNGHQHGDSDSHTEAVPIEPMQGSARDMLQDRAGIIVLREDLDFYAIPPKRDIDATEMLEVKRAAGRALLKQDGIFSGLRKSEEPGTTEQHLIEMLTAGYVSSFYISFL